MEFSRQQIQRVTETLLAETDQPEAILNELGEDLRELLGRVLDAKDSVKGIISTLENLL